MLADWDARLITPARALELAGDWPVYMGIDYADLSQFELEAGGTVQPGQWQVNVRCGKCHQSCGLFSVFHVFPDSTLIQEVEYAESNTGDILSGVLRHMVMAHDVSLHESGTDG